MIVEAGPPFRPCVVVPVFDHEQALPTLVERLRPSGLACWLVDDGSGPACAATIDKLVAAEPGWLRVERLPANRGKGVAVLAGFRAAQRAGFTHAVQIDADCQHDAADIPRFVAAARVHPGAIVNGVPQYDASVPKVRFYGRYITNVLVWLYTLSLQIRDSMCGFRVYPLAAAVALDETAPVGRRMQFDTDIIVRLHWSGVPVVNLKTPVTYPVDGVSHFDLLRDNLRMAGLHMRLAGGFVVRLPVLLARRIAASFAPRSDAERV
jgi:glycosyltransferase involved in cell wall biosynthesis